MARDSATAPWPTWPGLQNCVRPTVRQPGSLMTDVGVITPVLSPASAVTGLNVEPVGYAPAIARLNSGAPVAFEVSALYVDCESGLAKTDGLNDGTEPSARICPLRGSSATKPPGLPPPTFSSASWPAFCSPRSSESLRLRPGTGSRRRRNPRERPSELIDSSDAPSRPRR